MKYLSPGFAPVHSASSSPWCLFRPSLALSEDLSGCVDKERYSASL
uniref:Uncharacterized protein n=1 Tax=Anguilla anguilla TaxID=7936 RepID=A0A0E9PA89_ANGAN